MKEEKNAAVLKTAEISQSEERLKQQLRSESHEISELFETIQSIQVSLQTKTYEVERLTEQRQELETKLNDFHQQIESIDDLKNEIMDKSKVRIAYLLGYARKCEMFLNEFFSDDKNVKSTIGRHEKDVTTRIKNKWQRQMYDITIEWECSNGTRREQIKWNWKRTNNR